ncbi:sodium-translocating pyrophosphatase [Spirosoma utsteinense]|uniref:Putative K(+)-stimulated pyrophosphate-energized sodium pump n=1 Tax=Spirosoma utsteinense TaxID=2585773 RepID=A0ABR6W4S0_9BACT|nr:sodium-translocating pyrophosphatase [Spirosoma utsteinense]MBC3786036.1 K(+)-stimulated pyrophosphate-energized sodium pump [Spirosoma utsteinense]MBC3790735.1 K(+)-stimulated pyrophosphate-energized sodium pump [Spirosoma utsteinense]
MNNSLYIVPLLGLVGLVVMIAKFSWVNRQEAGDARMQEIAGYIADGAIAFLRAEWRVLIIFGTVVAAVLAFAGSQVENSHWFIGVAFAIGAFTSAFAGYIGMKVATKANVRTAHAARTSLTRALDVSFTGGSVMGIGVAGLAVLGLSVLFIFLYNYFVAGAVAENGILPVNGIPMERALEVLAGFSLGAESIALFARVAGGIYTKAADVGADLVGKVEAGIPEDDPRNPATIADNVGDNVGDVAGMGADLFGSYVATILATMVLGREIVIPNDPIIGHAPIVLPVLIAGMGLIFSILACYLVRVKDDNGNVQAALNLGNWGSIILTVVASYFLVNAVLPEGTMELRGVEFTRLDVFFAIVTGLVVGALMSIITEYYTAMGRRPVMSIIRQSATGAATNIIGGLAVGMESTVLPILVLAAGIYTSYHFAGLYGVAISAAGMMATTAMQLAIDAFGPIADNAGGIAEMSYLPEEVRGRTDILDAVGNTTAASGKGFAIASAALTALALFAAFVGISGISAIDIYKADVLSGLFVGAMIPYIFSSLAIAAVGRAAMAMVEEVRRQFREIPGIMEGTGKPEYEKCVAISTQASIREMILPGAIALSVPLIVGFIFGPEVLGGLLAGVTVSGVLMGIFMNNAGGAWDNAKKSFEKGVLINGEMFYKKSEPHKASVTGDTVGDPFKDTSGPSMNILIKLMSIVSLVIAPYIAVKSSDTLGYAKEGKMAAGTEVPLEQSTAADNKNVATPNREFTPTDLSLDGGVSLKGVDVDGIEANLLSFIKSDKVVDKETWFDFDRLTFETGSATLKSESQEQLKNIGDILKAYSNVNVKLGGYTDNTGNAASNLKLSGDRAQSVKKELVGLGIADSRLEAEGYGQEHPVASNDTEDGRAQNRRISIRVTKK